MRLCSGFLLKSVTNQNIKIMKYNEFFRRVMSDDETKHEFTLREKVVYGVVVPLAFLAVMCVAGYMETSCQ